MNRDEAITELCQFLEEQGGEVEEITSKKLWDRAEIIEDPDSPCRCCGSGGEKIAADKLGGF